LVFPPIFPNRGRFFIDNHPFRNILHPGCEAFVKQNVVPVQNFVARLRGILTASGVFGSFVFDEFTPIAHVIFSPHPALRGHNTTKTATFFPERQFFCPFCYLSLDTFIMLWYYLIMNIREMKDILDNFDDDKEILVYHKRDLLGEITQLGMTKDGHLLINVDEDCPQCVEEQHANN